MFSFSNFFFFFCRISLSDPYSMCIPNFKCQNNLKDPKHAKRQATIYSLSYSWNTINGECMGFKTSSKENQNTFETIACSLQLTSDWKFTTMSCRVAKDSNKPGCEIMLQKQKKNSCQFLLVAAKSSCKI